MLSSNHEVLSHLVYVYVGGVDCVISILLGFLAVGLQNIEGHLYRVPGLVQCGVLPL